MPPLPSPAELKRALRERMLAGRTRIPAGERAAASSAIADRLESHPAWKAARTVSLYAAMGAEVETAALARRALSAGKRVVWPRLPQSGRAMEFAACPESELVPGPARALEPPASAPAVPSSEVDLIAVPGLAFDVQGHRLGRGRGHYDATLAGLPRSAFRAGLAFESQVVPEVPAEPHDERLDAVVTETRILPAGGVSGGGPGVGRG